MKSKQQILNEQTPVNIDGVNYITWEQAIEAMESYAKQLHKPYVSGWVAYPETRPDKYGKYFVHRKDGKTHWETWNTSGFAYNDKVITHWMEVKPPCR